MAKILFRCIICFGVFLFWGTGCLNAQLAIDKINIKCAYGDKPLNLVFLDLKIKHQLNFEYEEKEIEGIRVNSFTGRLPIREAMVNLLQESGLDFELSDPRTVKIFKYIPKKEIGLESSKDQPSRKDFTIKGIIRDKNSGETLPFATVAVKGTSNGSASNVDGYFSLFNIPSDTVLLEVVYLGYHTTYFRLTPAMDLDNLQISMEDRSHQLAEVIVTATAEEQLLNASTGISRMSITPLAMATLPPSHRNRCGRSLPLRRFTNR